MQDMSISGEERQSENIPGGTGCKSMCFLQLIMAIFLQMDFVKRKRQQQEYSSQHITSL